LYRPPSFASTWICSAEPRATGPEFYQRAGGGKTANAPGGAAFNCNDAIGPAFEDNSGVRHVHFEALGYCDAIGSYVYIDPTLVANNYFSTASACEGIA